MQLLSQQSGEVIQTPEHNLQLVNMELDVTSDGGEALYGLQPHLQKTGLAVLYIYNVLYIFSVHMYCTPVVYN